MVSQFLKKYGWHDIILTGENAQDVNIGQKRHPGYFRDMAGIMGEPMVVPLVHFCVDSKNLLVKKPLRQPMALCFNEQRSMMQWIILLVLAASDSICPVSYTHLDVYKRHACE